MKSSAIVVLAVAGSAGLAASSPQVARTPNAAIVRAADYVAGYEAQLGGLVAEEDYVQELRRLAPRTAPRQKRTLKSDFMLVKFSAEEPFTPYRDVMEVDGNPVGDRSARLEQLFLQPGGQARQSATAISDESARYNLGRLRRNINVPTLALEYLKTGNINRCRFQTPRPETVGGEAAWKVDFKEETGPTVIKDLRTGRDVPASGSFWIRAADAAVLRTVVRIGGRFTRSEIDVKYCSAPKFAVLVPCLMSEQFDTREEEVHGKATYSNIRQFTVTTTESIKH